MDPLGAQEEVMELAAELGLSITVAVAYELLDVRTGLLQQSLQILSRASCLEFFDLQHSSCG